MITSRKCPLCGHHEVGYTTEDGVFHPLKPGTMIQIRDGSEISFLPEEEGVLGKRAGEEEVDSSSYGVWIPGPVKGDKRLRLKYGVWVKESSLIRDMSEEVYRFAYLDKLQHLVQKEIHTPIAVILDRFFTAPHLAAGNPRQIAEAMWRELEEIRRPVRLVGEWLNKQDEEGFIDGIHPVGKMEIDNQPVSEAEQQKELEELSLEEFLELL